MSTVADNNQVYCAMIHGGLNINLKNNEPWIQQCCLRRDRIPIKIGVPFWPHQEFNRLQQINLSGQWDSECHGCESLEKIGEKSFRQGTNQGLGMSGSTNLSGPARIDIMFDISCNLACRTCGASSSTFWQRQLKEIGEWSGPISTPRKKNEIIQTLATLNLENLREVVFSGGETLLGQQYWDVARWLVNQVPDAKSKLMLCFQTNGTQTISEKNYDVIENAKLVKLHVSIDGIADQFEYMRWPASWNQVTHNLEALKHSVPSNVMFLIEQTISIFNILDINSVRCWAKKNFSHNREQDPIDITRHLAGGLYSLNNATQQLVSRMQSQSLDHLISSQWKENPQAIKYMLSRIKKFDEQRHQSFEQTFPMIFDCFKQFW